MNRRLNDSVYRNRLEGGGLFYSDRRPRVRGLLVHLGHSSGVRCNECKASLIRVRTVVILSTARVGRQSTKAN
jgi:hypothetical protein